MSSQIVPIHRTNASGPANTDKKDIWFNAFDFQPGQDEHIRWLSRPNLDLVREKHTSDSEKFRVTFDVENFQSDQIKIYIQNRKLTISGVYEEHSEGRFMQKQFERTFDIPANADVDAMASFITPSHMLVVEIPLHASNQLDQLSVNKGHNDQRRVSYSLNKFNTSDQQQSLPPPGQQVRRTSMTKTTTTTTSSGSQALPAEASELLKNAETSTGGSSQTYTTHSTERRSSNTGHRQENTTNNNQTNLTTTDLANLPIEIPPELLAAGGTITIQKRKVSVTKNSDGHADHGVPVPVTKSSNETHSTNNSTNSLTTTSSTSAPSTSTTSERRGSKTISNSNQSRMMSLEEFLQNKTWNPSLVDGSNGKKILHMRLQMKPGTTSDQMKISLNGHDLRVEENNKVSSESGRYTNAHSYRQITLFSSCEVEHLTTELKDDGYLHVRVPINL